MTVSTNLNRVEYLGDGTSDEFTTPQFLANSHLKVYVDGTLQALTTDYTLTGAGAASGTATFVSPPADDTEIVILNDPPITQETDWVENDSDPAAAKEDAFDKLTLIAQRQADRIGRAIMPPDSDVAPDMELPAAASRASKYLVFDANGDVSTSSGTGTDAGLRADLASTDSGKGAELVAQTQIYPAEYLQTISALNNGDEVSIYRFLPSSVSLSGLRDGTETVSLETYINNALQAQADYTLAYDPPEANSVDGGARGTSPIIFFPYGAYYISDELELKTTYAHVKGQNSLIRKADDFAGTYGLKGAPSLAWRTTIESLQFENFDEAVYLDNTVNTNSGLIKIINCGFFANGYALRLMARSSYTAIINCLFRNNIHEAYLEYGDIVDWQGGWIQRGILTDDYDAGIINATGYLYMSNVLGVPPGVAQTVTEPAWIKHLGGSLRLLRTRFGTETGRTAVVNNYAVADIDSIDPPTSIMLDKCIVYPGASVPAIRLFEIPNMIRVRDCDGFVSSATAVDWSATVDGSSQTTKIAAAADGGGSIANGRLTLEITGNVVNNVGHVPENLLPYTRFARRDYKATHDASTYPISQDYIVTDTTVADGDVYLDENFIGYDATSGANGTRLRRRIKAVGTAGNVDMEFASCPASSTSLVTRMRVGSEGLTLLPLASVTPRDNGDLVFEATSDTTLTIKCRGSDGTVRSGTITLS